MWLDKLTQTFLDLPFNDRSSLWRYFYLFKFSISEIYSCSLKNTNSTDIFVRCCCKGVPADAEVDAPNWWSLFHQNAVHPDQKVSLTSFLIDVALFKSESPVFESGFRVPHMQMRWSPWKSLPLVKFQTWTMYCPGILISPFYGSSLAVLVN